MFFKSTILSGLHGALSIILILTNKNVALIYIQSQFVNHQKNKTGIVYRQGVPNINFSSIVFTFMLAVFHSHSPLLIIASPY